MKCKECKVEMLVDFVEEKEDTEVFHYKCPNKKCSCYGYKKEEKEQD